ncbi:uncharacterized protein ACLA_060310 [Aspergillus clavatus NRRL 1]|uniref:Uncharacterized protein n=1 Tax=Aspergillus clavatus (strain ATCC 1007 / CBS 513.65 / DSM 816 / NCTC 3887 / NRRL 1 / QM 1276 / 107) TaxID=344612 RepID=A1C4M3_ASPCL|nr:uncharacterized protein ACLA_060310 [Aspergillus clavatus NRRL 1]EAW15363.1 hypothetical protein ACLA_060310 [Aspergillus clavatus NRRL 1]
MALQDLLELGHEHGKYLRDLLKFGYGGMGAERFLDNQWLYGLAQSTLMSKDFA